MASGKFHERPKKAVAQEVGSSVGQQCKGSIRCWLMLACPRHGVAQVLSGCGDCIECDGRVAQAQTQKQADMYVLALCAGP